MSVVHNKNMAAGFNSHTQAKQLACSYHNKNTRLGGFYYGGDGGN